MFKKLRLIKRRDERSVLQVMTLWFCAEDVRARRPVRWLAKLTVLYVWSPIDLIPDFIPIIGHADDLLILPAAAGFVRRRVSEQVWEEADGSARAWIAEHGTAHAPPQVRSVLWGIAVVLVVIALTIAFAIWLLLQVMLAKMD